jgi:tripartite-type tricarboxylate transporter receptor subunit TctC
MIIRKNIEMKLVRRRFLGLAAAAATLPIAPQTVKAENFPARPVRIVVGFPPGGAIGSIVVRLIGQSLEQRWGQTVVLDNRPGAGGNVATALVVAAPPDGYTLILVGENAAINATLYKNLPFNFIRDIAMVAGIMQSPLAMLTNPAFAAKDVADFIAYAKANPGKINMASGGNGTVSHLAGELFQMRTGVAMVHVPYRGSAPALADLMAGRTQVMFENMATSIGFVRDGRLRALAVTTAAAWPALPGIPPVADVVPGYEVIARYSLGAPKATPAAIVAILNTAINACLTEPAIANRIHELAAEPMVMSPHELDAFIATDSERWAAAVKFSGAQVD